MWLPVVLTKKNTPLARNEPMSILESLHQVCLVDSFLFSEALWKNYMGSISISLNFQKYKKDFPLLESK